VYTKGEQQPIILLLNIALPKTFNNPVGFERGLWRRKTGLSLTVPKRSVFELA
jgi:hypothetical protein